MEVRSRLCDQLIGTKGKRCGEPVPNDEPTSFTLDGVGYEGDLCGAHKEDFKKAIEKFLAISEPTTTRAGNAIRKAMKGKSGAFTTKEVREWALAQGRDVSISGRVPNSLIEEYKDATHR